MLCEEYCRSSDCSAQSRQDSKNNSCYHYALYIYWTFYVYTKDYIQRMVTLRHLSDTIAHNDTTVDRLRIQYQCIMDVLGIHEYTVEFI